LLVVFWDPSDLALAISFCRLIQGDYLQGYLPIWLLAINAYTRQFLQNQYLASGPTFIDEPQSENAIQCEVDQFKVCPPPVEYDFNQITRVRPIGLALAGIVFVTGIGFAWWTVLYRKQPALAVSQVRTSFAEAKTQVFCFDLLTQ